jgi:hypothetical protein
MNQDTLSVRSLKDSRATSRASVAPCFEFLATLLRDLNQWLDRRLVSPLETARNSYQMAWQFTHSVNQVLRRHLYITRWAGYS